MGGPGTRALRSLRVGVTRGGAWHLLAAAVLAAALGGAAPRAASAQALSDLLSQVRAGSAPGDVLDASTEERALDTATRSFGYAATRRVDEILAAHPDVSDARKEHLRERAAQVTRSFAEEARDELIDAKGDGLLTKQELAEEMAEAREAQLTRLEQVLQAALVGAEEAPDREAFAHVTAWLAALSRYTLLERNSLLDWGRFAACVAIALVMALGAVTAASHLLRRRHGRSRAAARSLHALRGPLVVVAAALGLAWGLEQVWLPGEVEEQTALAVRLLVAAACLWVLWDLSASIGRWIARLFLRHDDKATGEMADMARKGVRLAALVAFAMVVVEGVFGTDLTTLLAGVGVAGVVATIAAQDTLRNVVGSVTLHGDRPFLVGDRVWFQGRYGTVEEIGFRSTRIRTFDGPVLVVPNAELVRESVVNLSVRPWVRHVDTVDLVYGTPPERVEEAVEIVSQILRRQDHPEDHPPHVTFHGFGAHSLRLRMWYYSKTSDWFEAQHHRGRVNGEILRRFQDEGLEFAFPTRTLHVASAPSEAPAGEADDARQPADGDD